MPRGRLSSSSGTGPFSHRETSFDIAAATHATAAIAPVASGVVSSTLEHHLERLAASLVQESLVQSVQHLRWERELDLLARSVSDNQMELALAELADEGALRSRAIEATAASLLAQDVTPRTLAGLAGRKEARTYKGASMYSLLDSYYYSAQDPVSHSVAPAAESDDSDSNPSRESLECLKTSLAEVRGSSGSSPTPLPTLTADNPNPDDMPRRGSGDTFGPDSQLSLDRPSDATRFSTILQTITEQSVVVVPRTRTPPISFTYAAPLSASNQKPADFGLWPEPKFVPLSRSPLSSSLNRSPRPSSVSSDDEFHVNPRKRQMDKAFKTLGISRKAMATLGIENEVSEEAGTLGRKTKRSSLLDRIDSAGFLPKRMSLNSFLTRPNPRTTSLVNLSRIPSDTSLRSARSGASNTRSLRRKSIHLVASLPSFSSAPPLPNPVTKHNPQQTLHAGMLKTSKQKPKAFFRTWKSRYCVLTRGFLYLYNTAPPAAGSLDAEDERKPDDVLYVGVGTEFKVVPEGNGKKAVFGFSFRSGGAKILYFSCEDIQWKPVVESLILEESQPRLTLRRSQSTPTLPPNSPAFIAEPSQP
ncbi:hypothetical protein HKX48_002332, partial [Thoreauomyces humboldtii]